jgi:cytochrome o ubiquinol oxidase subunit 3
MNVAVAVGDEVRYEARPSASEAGPATKRIVVGYGFWVFLLSDIVMFSAIFAAYAVLAHATAGGPGGVQLFNQRSVAIETGCLLASSYTCGLMSMAISSRRYAATYLAALVTFVLGAAFLVLELREFAGMIAIGAGPQRSAFLSAFFTLVGCHGLHVTAGLVWLVVMMAQVAIKGFHATVERRLLCFSLFWHALDIVWVWLFTVVYLMGVLS